MNIKTVLTILIIGVTTASTILCIAGLYSLSYFSDTRVVFLDVGQGDATLISEGSYQILIDGGPDGRKLLEALGKEMPFWDRTIDLVIATHPDSDHIDGLVAVFDMYDVHAVWHNHEEKETSVAEALSERIESELQHGSIPYAGDRVIFPSGSYLEVVYPFREARAYETNDSNDHSIAATFQSGEDVFFLGGDLSSEVEDILPLDSYVTVLKAGHHGSKTSSSDLFLKRVGPREIVISSGHDNRYGHPHESVLKRLLKTGARVWRTDQDGVISYRCDGKCVKEF